MATAPIPIDYTTYSRILDMADALVRKGGKGLTRMDALHALMQAYPTDARYADAARRYGRGQTARARTAVTQAPPAPPVRKVEASATTQPALPQPSFAALVERNRALGMNPDQAWALAQRQSPAAHEAFRNPGGTPVPVQKQAPPSPPPSATDTLMAEIAKCQADEPGLSFLAALNAVQKEAPELYDQYVRDTRYPHLRGQPMPTQAVPAPTYEAILVEADAQVAKAAGLSRRDALSALAQEHPHDKAYYEAYRKYYLSDGITDYHKAVLAKGRVG